MKDYLLIIGVIIIGYIVIGCIDVFRTKKIINSNVPLTVKDAYDILYNIVKNCVLELNQTFVDQLKKDGEFDDDSKMIVKDLAIAKVKDLLSDELKSVLIKYLGEGNLTTYISSIIESVLYTEKNNNVNTITLETATNESSSEIDPFFEMGSSNLEGGFLTTITNSMVSEQGEAIDQYLKSLKDADQSEETIDEEEEGDTNEEEQDY